MPVQRDLLEFSSTQEPWLSDLIRRASTQPTITDVDINEVEVMLLDRHDQSGTQTSACVPIPLCESHLPVSAVTEDEQMTLKELCGIANVDRLTPGQNLPFSPEGITVIYGDNGSGKSGYCRILKRLCRGRQDRQEPLLGDVLSPGIKPPATAIVKYAIQGVEQEPVAWSDGDPSPTALSCITVFDANAAPLYADKQSEIEFLPHGLDVLPQVGKALELLAKRLDAKIETLESSTALPPVAINTSLKVGKFLEGLTSGATGRIPTLQEIETATTWNDACERNLSELQVRIGNLTQPEKIAQELRVAKMAIDGLASDIDATAVKIDEVALATMSKAISDFRAARDAADLAAAGQFASEPLGSGVGSEPWRNLFEYARQFSALAYPGERFPVVGPGKRCLLCQQPLEEEASQRLLHFQQFVENRAQQDLNTISKRIATLSLEIERIRLPGEQDLRVRLASLSNSDDPFDASLAEEVLDFYSRIEGRLSDMKRLLSEQNAAGSVSFYPPSPAPSLRAVSQKIDKRLREVTKTGHSKAESLRAERDEMEATKILHQNTAILLKRRKQLLQLEIAQNCRKSCNTYSISLKNSELREKYLTKELKERVRKEITSLGLQHLPLKIEAKTDHGTSLVGVTLEKSVNVTTSRILSEGEFRALALACFFAEVDSIPGNNAIIVDDPVSSLDHSRIRQVARRIIEEAARRQVIVFTHDLSFFYDLWEAAAENNMSVTTHQLERQSSTICGAVKTNDAPWQAKKVKERLTVIERMLDQIPDPASCSQEKYWRHTEDLYSRLRETWERFVEEKLLNSVVSRFQSGVQTQSLRGVLVEDEDYRKIFFAMKKASTFSGHDTAVSRQTSPPSQEEMKRDIEELRTYEKELHKRQDQIEKNRRALETPRATPNN